MLYEQVVDQAEHGDATKDLNGNAGFRYDRASGWVLRGLDASFSAGAVHAVVGGNGCGKSTMLSVLAKTVKLQRGHMERGAASAALLPQNPKALLAPRVKVFFSTKSRLPLPQSIVDLSKITDQDRIVGRESAEEWGFERLDELWSGMDLEGRGR